MTCSLVNAVGCLSVCTLSQVMMKLYIALQDVSDLFGSDLPVEGGRGVNFAWRDGPFLKALKNGDWILLDEVIQFDCLLQTF